MILVKQATLKFRFKKTIIIFFWFVYKSIILAEFSVESLPFLHVASVEAALLRYGGSTFKMTIWSSMLTLGYNLISSTHGPFCGLPGLPHEMVAGLQVLSIQRTQSREKLHFYKNLRCYLVSFQQTLWLKAVLPVAKIRNINANHTGGNVCWREVKQKEIKWLFLENTICFKKKKGIIVIAIKMESYTMLINEKIQQHKNNHILLT